MHRESRKYFACAKTLLQDIFHILVIFNPKNVADVLGIKDTRSCIRNFTDKQKILVKNSDLHSMHIRKLNNAGEIFLTESGVFKLAFRSRKPEAEKFTDWVTDDVLPQIRKKWLLHKSKYIYRRTIKVENGVNFCSIYFRNA